MRPSNEEFLDRVRGRLQQELQEPEKWFYFSFANEKFMGGFILRCHGVTDGLMKIHALKMSPGGEVLCMEVPEDVLPDEQYRNRLLTKEDVDAAFKDSGGAAPLELLDNETACALEKEPS